MPNASPRLIKLECHGPRMTVWKPMSLASPLVKYTRPRNVRITTRADWHFDHCRADKSFTRAIVAPLTPGRTMASDAGRGATGQRGAGVPVEAVGLHQLRLQSALSVLCR